MWALVPETRGDAIGWGGSNHLLSFIHSVHRTVVCCCYWLLGNVPALPCVIDEILPWDKVSFFIARKVSSLWAMRNHLTETTLYIIQQKFELFSSSDQALIFHPFLIQWVRCWSCKNRYSDEADTLHCWGTATYSSTPRMSDYYTKGSYPCFFFRYHPLGISSTPT